MKEHCVSTAMHAKASLVRLRHGGKATWTSTKDAREPQGRRAEKKAKRAKVVTEEAVARAYTKMAKDWERLNVKDARKFWRGSVAAAPAGSAMGSLVEQRQAKAQRSHAEACQQEADLELARLPVGDVTA